MEGTQEQKALCVVEESQGRKGLSDEVLIEIVHGVKEVIVLLIEKLCEMKREVN